MNPEERADNLCRQEDGLWIARTRGAVSYPEDGNSLQDAGFHRHSFEVAGLFDVLERIENDADGSG